METIKMGRWRSFLDSLDTGGGHVFVLIVLLLIGCVFFKYDSTAGGQIITLAFGALLALLKDRGTNRDQMSGTGTLPAAPPPPPPSPVQAQP